MRWACFLLLLLSQIARASDWHKPETELAGKIAAAIGPGVIALEVTNRSSISSAEADTIRREITEMLSASGIRVWQPDQAAATVRLTLSENPQNYVWVAEIQQATNEKSVLIVSAPRPESILNTQNLQPVQLHISNLISRAEPILDFAIIEGNPRRLLALGAGEVTIYELKDGKWNAGQSLALRHVRPLPRDLRGRIFLRSDHLFDAYLPGLFCRSTNSSPLAASCSVSDDPWPIENESLGVSGFFSPARNFFTGALAPGIGKQKSAPAFYSAAAVPKSNYALWIFSGVDGQTYLLDGINQQAATKIHWGSSIAGVRMGCRPGWQVLATLPEDNSQESVQAFEFPDREPVAVSQKISLNGNTTALWTGQDGNDITAVILNSQTGNYEAVKVSLTCSQ